MTKHYCDMCGKELDKYEVTEVTVEPEPLCIQETKEEYELCPECAGKVRDLIIYGEEICQQ